MRITSSVPLLLCLVSSFTCSGGLMATDDESKPFVSQTPREGGGGCLAIARPVRKTGGWNHVYRAADDFLLYERTEIEEVVWWGCSYDGRHGEDDGLDQVLGFAIAIHEHNLKTNQPGRCVHRTIVPLHDTAPQRTRFECFGGSDVMRFNASLVIPFQAEAETTYWLSVTAYLSGEPMWVWFEGNNGNARNAIDYGVDGNWNDRPADWDPLDLAFVLRSSAEREERPENVSKERIVDQKDGHLVIKSLIKQLGNDEYVEREAAEDELTEIGKAAVPFLTPHLKHDDPEIRYRVRCLLTKCGTLEKPLSMKIHTVRVGENISDLAKLYDLSGDAIVTANALGDEPPLAGTMLFIPR